MTYEEFVFEEIGISHLDDGQEFSEEYEIYLSSTSRKETITPIRYDYNPNHYSEGRHPASHIHIGHSNNIRICSKKVLHPISFFLFVIRQCFPEKWSVFHTFPDAPTLCKKVRQTIPDINGNLFNQKDLWEMYLS